MVIRKLRLFQISLYQPSGNASFIIDTMTVSQRIKADLVELKVESLYYESHLALIT